MVHGANMGPFWGRHDPCWPHEPYYLGQLFPFLGSDVIFIKLVTITAIICMKLVQYDKCIINILVTDSLVIRGVNTVKDLGQNCDIFKTSIISSSQSIHLYVLMHNSHKFFISSALFIVVFIPGRRGAACWYIDHFSRWIQVWTCVTKHWTNSCSKHHLYPLMLLWCLKFQTLCMFLIYS